MTIIPWVVRRDTEHPDRAAAVGWHFVAGINIITGEEEVILDGDGAYRDEDGWLWMPAPDDMSGAPEFTQVHPTRQRLCMDEGRCQVCGEKKDALVWIVPSHQPGITALRTTSAGLTVVSYTPPVCPECEPIARRLCPFLRRSDWKTYVPRRVLRWGVLGDLHEFPDGACITRGGLFQKIDPAAPRVIARQRAVRLVGLEEWE